jgi:hypothetical protein
MRKLLLVVVVVSGCRAEPPCVIEGTHERRFQVTAMTVPRTRSELAVDLNGDRKEDNQLGNTMSALIQQSINPQEYVDAAIKAGIFKPIIDVRSTDALGRNADGAGAVFGDGDDPGTFCGWIAGGRYESRDGELSGKPVTLSMTLPFFENARVPVFGAQLRYLLDGDTMTGQLNAAVPREEVVSRIIPGVAKLVQKKIDGDPNAGFSMTLQSLFDNGGVDEGCNGGCRNPDGSCGIKANGLIEVCEVATNSIVKNLAAPDVQMFNRGVYDPQKENRDKDSWSLGVGFTAVEVK